MLIDVSVDDEDYATELMVHHLKMAAALFECTHSDRGLKANEVIRKRMGTEWMNAASAFVEVMCQAHEDISDAGALRHRQTRRYRRER